MLSASGSRPRRGFAVRGPDEERWDVGVAKQCHRNQVIALVVDHQDANGTRRVRVFHLLLKEAIAPVDDRDGAIQCALVIGFAAERVTEVRRQLDRSRERPVGVRPGTAQGGE